MKVLGTILILYSGLTYSHPNEDYVNHLIAKHGNESWFTCQKNEDCSYARNNCNYSIAVNKKSQQLLAKLIWEKKGDCLDLVGPNLPDGVECKKLKCSLIITER